MKGVVFYTLLYTLNFNRMEQFKKDKLIIALQEEKHHLDNIGYCTEDHELTIHYLRTNEIKRDLDDNEILEACINDFDCLYNDYCI